MNPIAKIMDRPQQPPNSDITSDIVDIVRMPLGTYLKKHRQQTKTTMQELADAIGCDISYVSKVENNKVIPPWDMLEDIADFYKIEKNALAALAWKQLEASKGKQLNLAIAFCALAL